MKPRLFWTMLLAFILVIVLSVCGMLSFFALAVTGFWTPDGIPAVVANSARAEVAGMQRFWVQRIAEQYAANGNSWSNIDQHLSQSPMFGVVHPPGYILVDTDGRVIASSDQAWPVGGPIDAAELARGAPVEVRGTRVGTLILLPQQGPDSGPIVPAVPRRPPDFVWPILRSFVVAGLALVSVLLVLAVIFARRISRPLRGITAAAQELAAGRLDVEVRGASVRELDELARAFNAMARSLAQADHQRRQMTADIAHELRTPLTIIKGRLEGLQDGVYSATPDQIGRLLDETALLERLIEDLRLLALADTGQLPLYPEPLDPRDLLADAAAAFADQATAQEVTLHVDAPDDLPSVNADPLRMAQVLSNLVANALRYTPAGGSVTLHAEFAPPERECLPAQVGRSSAERGLETGDRRLALRRPLDRRPRGGLPALPPDSPRLVVSVRDTGQGIAPEELAHIFERFWRADRSRARGSGGAGLGLAITRQIVLAHGGAIWAESTPGQGTTISVALPVAVGARG